MQKRAGRQRCAEGEKERKRGEIMSKNGPPPSFISFCPHCSALLCSALPLLSWVTISAVLSSSSSSSRSSHVDDGYTRSSLNFSLLSSHSQNISIAIYYLDQLFNRSSRTVCHNDLLITVLRRYAGNIKDRGTEINGRNKGGKLILGL